MPTQQTSSNQSKNKNKKGAQASGGARKASASTSERDDTYGLISVIYHSLQGAETCDQYAEDARRAGNDELVQFFEECRDEQNQRALEGRRLLTAELRDLDDEVEAQLEEEGDA